MIQLYTKISVLKQEMALYYVVFMRIAIIAIANKKLFDSETKFIFIYESTD